MLNRTTALLLGTACFLALFTTFHAIDFAVQFDGANTFDPEFDWPFMHASTINFAQQPAGHLNERE